MSALADSLRLRRFNVMRTRRALVAAKAAAAVADDGCTCLLCTLRRSGAAVFRTDNQEDLAPPMPPVPAKEGVH